MLRYIADARKDADDSDDAIAMTSSWSIRIFFLGDSMRIIPAKHCLIMVECIECILNASV